MKLLADFFPIILFFVAYKVWGIYAATAAAIVASVAQIGWVLARGRRVEPMQWTSLLIIVVFGGMTLIFQDETFIKWKPTVLYGVFAVALLVARFAMGRNLIRAMMEKQIRLPERTWGLLNWTWVVFFVLMAVLNIVVAYSVDTDTWVQFKLFGTLALTLLFVIGQALWIGRLAEESPP